MPPTRRSVALNSALPLRSEAPTAPPSESITRAPAGSPFPSFAPISARTRTIEIGTAVIDMLWENPVYIAEGAGRHPRGWAAFV